MCHHAPCPHTRLTYAALHGKPVGRRARCRQEWQPTLARPNVPRYLSSSLPPGPSPLGPVAGPRRRGALRAPWASEDVLLDRRCRPAHRRRQRLAGAVGRGGRGGGGRGGLAVPGGAGRRLRDRPEDAARPRRAARAARRAPAPQGAGPRPPRPTYLQDRDYHQVSHDDYPSFLPQVKEVLLQIGRPPLHRPPRFPPGPAVWKESAPEYGTRRSRRRSARSRRRVCARRARARRQS
jgi:hypothetical protein